MLSRIKRTAKLLLTVLMLCSSNLLTAGNIPIWRFSEITAAPVLVVARIMSVERGERIPQGTLPWKAETFAMTATIQVVRSFTASGKQLSSSQIRVRFLGYGQRVGSLNGYPPPLPNLEVDRVLLLPFKENKAPSSDQWELMADSGLGLTIPVRAEMPDSIAGTPPADGHAFLVREIANTISFGTSAELSSVVGSLSIHHEDLSAELIPLVQPMIGHNSQRWAEVGTSLLVSQPDNRPTIAELLAQRTVPARSNNALLQLAFQKLKANPETHSLLIHQLIAQAADQGWGASLSLVEYADDPVTLQALRKALADNVPGSFYIARYFAQEGHKAILADALAQALRVVDQPPGDRYNLPLAADLLRDFGDDSQFKQLVQLVRKYQTTNREFYNVLWRDAARGRNLRQARVLAVVLQDRQLAFDQTRSCDLALQILQSATAQSFGPTGTEKERDEAVTRGLAWIKSHGLLD